MTLFFIGLGLGLLVGLVLAGLVIDSYATEVARATDGDVRGD